MQHSIILILQINFQEQLNLKKYSLFRGGCGFVSKTIMYPMFPGREGVRAVKTVFDKTRVPRVHGHSQDLKSGVSPHILKCTRYQGRTLEMGRCRIKIIEKAPVSRDACR